MNQPIRRALPGQLPGQALPGQLPGQAPRAHMQGMAYVVPFLAFAASSQVVQTIQMETGFDFWWVKGAYFADIAAAGQTESTRVIPIVDVQMNFSENSANAFKDAIPVSSIFGTGDRPHVLAEPIRVPAGSTITFTANNRTTGGGAITYNLYLVLHGKKSRAGAFA